MLKLQGVFERIVPLLGALLLLTPLVSQKVLAQDKRGNTSRDLLRLSEAQTVRRAAPAQPQDLAVTPMRPPVRGDKVLVDAVAAGDIADLKAELDALGMEPAAAYGRIYSGWLPLSAINKLEGLKSLKYARPAYRSSHVGLTTSGGDPALRADLARDEFEVDGSRVIIGVLSDTYDDAGIPLATNADDDIASGDLPPDVIVLDDTGGPGIDEGRAMMQHIYDVAPGAGLSFHTAFNGQADFALGIQELAGCPPGSGAGCVPSPNPADVIVDDIIYPAEPMFQDGIIAQAVDVVVAAGKAYFSSAGNAARRSYESPFAANGNFEFDAFPRLTSFAPPFYGGTAHDFGGGDFCQSVTLPAEADIFLSFQWSESFFSVTGVPFAGSSLADYDVYIMLEGPGGAPVGILNGGVEQNIFSGDAVELTGLANAGVEPIPLCLMLVQFAKLGDDGVIGASGTDLLKYVRFGSSSVRVNEFDTQSSTIYGHSNAAGAEAVGAARYTQTPVFGVDPPLIEFFSSAGGTPIFFDSDGMPNAEPEVRLKPGVTGPNGGNTTFFFPGSPDLENDGFPNFFGTSASAPHIAGVAALLIEACDSDDDCSEDDGNWGGLTPDQTYGLLRSSAADMDDPDTHSFDQGFDFRTGFGFVNACKALASLEGEDDDECDEDNETDEDDDDHDDDEEDEDDDDDEKDRD